MYAVYIEIIDRALDDLEENILKNDDNFSLEQENRDKIRFKEILNQISKLDRKWKYYYLYNISTNNNIKFNSNDVDIIINIIEKSNFLNRPKAELVKKLIKKLSKNNMKEKAFSILISFLNDKTIEKNFLIMALKVTVDLNENNQEIVKLILKKSIEAKEFDVVIYCTKCINDLDVQKILNIEGFGDKQKGEFFTSLFRDEKIEPAMKVFESIENQNQKLEIFKNLYKRHDIRNDIVHEIVKFSLNTKSSSRDEFIDVLLNEKPTEDLLEIIIILGNELNDDGKDALAHKLARKFESSEDGIKIIADYYHRRNMEDDLYRDFGINFMTIWSDNTFELIKKIYPKDFEKIGDIRARQNLEQKKDEKTFNPESQNSLNINQVKSEEESFNIIKAFVIDNKLKNKEEILASQKNSKILNDVLKEIANNGDKEKQKLCIERLVDICSDKTAISGDMENSDTTIQTIISEAKKVFKLNFFDKFLNFFGIRTKNVKLKIFMDESMKELLDNSNSDSKKKLQIDKGKSLALSQKDILLTSKRKLLEKVEHKEKLIGRKSSVRNKSTTTIGDSLKK